MLKEAHTPAATKKALLMKASGEATKDKGEQTQLLLDLFFWRCLKISKMRAKDHKTTSQDAEADDEGGGRKSLRDHTVETPKRRWTADGRLGTTVASGQG